MLRNTAEMEALTTLVTVHAGACALHRRERTVYFGRSVHQYAHRIGSAEMALRIPEGTATWLPGSCPGSSRNFLHANGSFPSAWLHSPPLTLSARLRDPGWIG